MIASTLRSAIRTFVLPRSANDLLTRIVFLVMRVVFSPFTGARHTYAARGSAMALYAPVSLIVLPVIWMTLVLFGYMVLYVAAGVALATLDTEDWEMIEEISPGFLNTIARKRQHETRLLDFPHLAYDEAAGYARYHSTRRRFRWHTLPPAMILLLRPFASLFFMSGRFAPDSTTASGMPLPSVSILPRGHPRLLPHFPGRSGSLSSLPPHWPPFFPAGP